jgi:hypothetical protein
LNADEITTLFEKQLKKIEIQDFQDLKTTIADSKHEWLHGIAPDTIISSEKHKMECQPLIDTMSEFELILPFYQANKLNLKKLPVKNVIIADLPYNHEQLMDEYDQVKVSIPFTGGAEGCREAFLRVWVASPVATKLQYNEEKKFITNEKIHYLQNSEDGTNNEKRKFGEVSNTAAGASNKNHVLKCSSVINDTSSADDKNVAEKINKIENIVDSSSSVFQSPGVTKEGGYIIVSPVETTRVPTAENFIVIGFPGLMRLNLKVDPGNKRLFAVRMRKMLI